MGSFFEKQRPPTVSSSTSTPAVVPTQDIEADTEAQKRVEESGQSEIRSRTLLERSRGRFGTILTGFNGFLDQNNDKAETRKTLLGE